jgi:hypothetical protein
LSEDPIGFEGGDPNLARYVGNSPTSLIDPTGLMSWKHQVEQEPNLDGLLGYEAKILQTVNADPGDRQIAAPQGTQTWQINYAEYFIVVTDGKTSRTLSPKLTTLDVNDITGKRPPMKITDTVALAVRDLPEDQKVVVLVEKVKKRLGFRPYDKNANSEGHGLPLGNRQPLKAGQPEILKTMMGPRLEADTLYIYIDRDACRLARVEHLKEAFKFIGTGAPTGLPTRGTYEECTYDELGKWFAFAGPQTSR